jgi:uncharacterized membrane protein
MTAEAPKNELEARIEALEDVLGGRVLAWLGGAATLLGIVLLLVLAVSHGWIDRQARVLLAGGASAALIWAGSWLHAHRGKTEAAMAMVGTGTAGLFATLIVASNVYGLLPDALALAGVLAVGALASGLAIRWAGRPIGGLGLIGALLARPLVGAPIDSLTIAILAFTAACAMWVVVWQRWGWLSVGTVLICAPQWLLWILQGSSPAAEALVLALFVGIGLLGAVGAQLRQGEQRPLPSAVAAIVLSSGPLALAGWLALDGSAGETAGTLWLAGVACAHVTAALVRVRGVRVASTLHRVLIAIGVTLADLAFAHSADGVMLALGWSATAAMFAWLAHRGGAHEQRDARLFKVGVGAQLLLVLVRLLGEAPPSGLVSGNGQTLPVLTALALIASCVACGRLGTAARRQWWLIGAGAVALYLASLATVAAFQATAATVSGGAFGLSVHQQGQVALSALWGLVGLAALIAGLRMQQAPARGAGLALLFVAICKVFLFDLSTLTSVYRVVSFIVLGLLALAGAFAYQRLRPPPLPDMRTLHPSQR